MTTKMQEKFTEPQQKFIQYLARGKKNKKGEKRTMEQFAAAIDVNAATLYRWQYLDGFADALLEATQRELAPLLPSLSNAVTGKAFGQKGFKNIDIPAANLAIKLMGVAERRIVDAKQEVEHSGRIGVDLTTKSDAELDAIIAGGVA